MADLTEQQSAQTIKLTGANASGIEDNYLDVDSSGRITANQGAAGAANWLMNLAAFGGTSVSLGQTTMSASIPVTLASNQSALAVSGPLTDTQLRATPVPVSGTVAATQSGTWTVQPGNTANTTPWLVTVSTALPTGANTIGAVTQASGPWTINLTQVGGSALALGQTTMASSIPVTLASNQSALAVSQSGTWTTARSWTLASGTDSVAAVQSGTWTVAQGTAAALSGAWPIKLTDGTNTMPTMDTVSRAGFYKVTDGTNTAAVKAASTAAAASDPALVVSQSPNSTGNQNLTQIGGNTVVTGGVNGSLGVGGLASSGAAVAGKPVLVAGSDGTNARTILTDTAGRLVIAGQDSSARSIAVIYSGSQTVAGAQAGMFFNGVRYTVPSNYKFTIGTFNCHSANTRAIVRASLYKQLATYNMGTNVFTDVAAYSSPQFASALEAEVTTATANTNDTTVTVTYTNQSGTTGQTATALVPKNTPAGYKVLFTLAAGDYGITDITAVSDSSATTGILSLNGIVLLFQQDINTANYDFQFVQSFGSVVVNAGDTLALDVQSTAAATEERTIRAIGVLGSA